MWKYIKSRSTENPTKSDKILEQLANSKLKKEKLRLFSPWGPRYKRDTPKIKDSDSEIITLKEIKEIFGKFNEIGYSLDFLLMPADIYGIKINTLSEKFVQEYFKWLSEATYKILEGTGKIRINPWSKIKNKNKDRYNELKRNIDENFNELVKKGEYKKTVEVAKIFNSNNPEESAKDYCIERLIEGIIINEIYNPIKLSMVRKEKDSLDGPLKRIYIIQNKAPWLEEDNGY